MIPLNPVNYVNATLTITTEEAERETRVTVSDDGIPDAMTYPQILPVIYEKLQNWLKFSNVSGIGGE